MLDSMFMMGKTDQSIKHTYITCKDLRAQNDVPECVPRL